MPFESNHLQILNFFFHFLMKQEWHHTKEVEYFEVPETSPHTEFAFPDNSDYLSDLNQKLLESRKYSIDQIKKIEEGRKTKKVLYKTRGFISFLNYMKEVKDPKSKVINEKLPVRGTKQAKRNKKHFDKIQIVEVSPTSFQSTKSRKEAGIWDENSYEAFTMSALSMLNRLTKQNMDLTINELKALLKGSEQISFFTQAIVDKVPQEHAFSLLYATFTSRLHFKNIERRIVELVLKKFFECCNIALTLDENSDTHVLTGCSKFVACLIQVHSISVENGIKCVNEMVKNFNNQKIPSAIVEMLLIFVQNINEDFALKMPSSTWDKIIQVKKENQLPSRIKYLLEDIEEIYEHVILKQPKKAISSVKPLPLHSDSKMYLVRDAFTNYKEETGSFDVDLPTNEFLRAAGDLFPDQTRDPSTYCEFICDILEKEKADPTMIVDVLGKCASEYCKNKIEGDSPKMWALFDDLLYYLILRKIINCDDAQLIMKNFPAMHESDIINGMKWFLCDKHNFTKAINLPNFPSDEIKDALLMPETIHKPIPENLKMSRLIAISIMRSIAEVISNKENPFDALKEYIEYLALIDDRYIGFKVELEGIIDYYGFDFTLDDVYNLFDILFEEEEEFYDEAQK